MAALRCRVPLWSTKWIQLKTKRKLMNILKHNMGKTDRIIRIVIGVLLIANVFVALQHPIGWLGVVLLVTGITGICPIYSLLNIETKSTAEKVGLK